MNPSAQNKILLVEDDQDVREVMGFFFQFHNIEYDSTESADQALLKLDQNDYELVLSDIRMPGKSGLDLLKEIRASYGLKQKVILMSAHTEYTLEEIYNSGAQGFIQKPFENRYIDLFVTEMKNSAKNHFDQEKETEKPLLKIEAPEFVTDVDSHGQCDLLFGCGGFCLRSSKALDFSLTDVFPFQIDFKNEEKGHSLKGQAIVRWLDYRDGTYFLGAEIVYVDEAGRTSWTDWVASKKTVCFIPWRKKLD